MVRLALSRTHFGIDGSMSRKAMADRMRNDFTAGEDDLAAGEVIPGAVGIGMGLTVVVTNVRAMGGTLNLVTAGEAGATIIIRLTFDESHSHSDTASERIRRRLHRIPFKGVTSQS